MNVYTDSPYGPTREASNVTLEDQDVLPAYNLTWSPRPTMNVRLGYSTTVARPELRELSPFSMYNFETGYSEVGDTTLVTTYLRNYDFRWEIFPSRQELAAASVFYKNLDHPIEKYVRGGSGDYELGPLNGLDGILRGVEFELRMGLGSPIRWVARRPAPAFLDSWGIMANYSKVHSEVHLSAPSGVLTTPLNGQSDETLNLGLLYASKRVDSALLYKSFGARLASFGMGVLPDIYEHPMRSLDFTFGWQAMTALRLKLFAENLLDEEVVFRQGEYVTQRYMPGRKIGFAVNYSTRRNDG
jgi:outer membrane receptor protein involved in Fe transport